MANLLSARACGHATMGLPCRFYYDGSTYLIATNSLDFVWVPADGYHRTRLPYPNERCTHLQGQGYDSAYDYYHEMFLVMVEEYFREEEEEEKGGGTKTGCEVSLEKEHGEGGSSSSKSGGDKGEGDKEEQLVVVPPPFVKQSSSTRVDSATTSSDSGGSDDMMCSCAFHS